ncbi:MAG: glycosyltransferase family 1 protein [Thermoleophilaceae bacterium]|nr:glycosyltransferase family 1 protein [Thermoleophilaceae bacterium]
MRLLAITFGTRGDVEPFLTLGSGLASAGHDVRLVSHAMFDRLATDSGVEFVGSPGRGMREIIESDEAQEMMNGLGNPLTLPRRLEALFGDDVNLMYESVNDAAQDVDAILCFPATFPAMDVAELRGIPVIQVHHVPLMPTRAFPPAVNFVHRKSLGPVGNRLAYSADAAATAVAMRRPLNAARERILRAPRKGVIGTLRQRNRFSGALVGVSPHVLPPPPDWPGNVETCGYWWPRGNDAPPLSDELNEFLDRDGPVVFFTLGSTALDDADRITRVVTEAARDAGVRLILQRGWSGLGDGIDQHDVLVVDDLSYPELFDRVTAVVHHGGAGTTALGLRHGLPSMAISAIADQFFWGHRLQALGVGPRPLALSQLVQSELADRISSLVEEQRYLERATILSNLLANEDGVANAVVALDRIMATKQWS